MQIGRIEGTTRELGKEQGYVPLPIRDIVVNCTVDGSTPAMESAWFPTIEEMQRMVDGAPIILRVMGRTHPPVLLGVGEIPR